VAKFPASREIFREFANLVPGERRSQRKDTVLQRLLFRFPWGANRELRLRADQIHYAMTLALNEAAEVTRTLLIKDTWPTHVRQQNQSFISASPTSRSCRRPRALDLGDDDPRIWWHILRTGAARAAEPSRFVQTVQRSNSAQRFTAIEIAPKA
jgi:hypothetical protein